jgi:DnaK suppressor protein
MTREQLAHFERRLLEERARIVKRLVQFGELSAERTSDSDNSDSAYAFHMADRGTDSMEREKAFLLASKEGRFLYHIDGALRRLYTTPERYGQCEDCGSEIGYARLDVLPHARLCIRCKESEEGATSLLTAPVQTRVASVGDYAGDCHGPL